MAPVASPPKARWNLGLWEPQAPVLTLSGGLASQADTGELDSLGVQDPQGGVELGWGPARALLGARWGGGAAQAPVLVGGLRPTGWHSWWYLCLFTASSAYRGVCPAGRTPEGPPGDRPREAGSFKAGSEGPPLLLPVGPAVTGRYPGPGEQGPGGPGASTVRQAHPTTSWATKARVGVGAEQFPEPGLGIGGRRHLAPPPGPAQTFASRTRPSPRSWAPPPPRRHPCLALVVSRGSSLHLRT